MNKKDTIMMSLYAGITILYFIVMTMLLASCSATKPPSSPVVDSRPARAKYVYKVETVSKDNDTTFQKIIR